MNSILNWLHYILGPFETFMQRDGGGLVLPEMMLVLFAMGILLTDYLLEARDKFFNALMAMLGVMFSWITLVGTPMFLARIPLLRVFAVPGLREVAERAPMGFSQSIILDPFFVFFGAISLDRHGTGDHPFRCATCKSRMKITANITL